MRSVMTCWRGWSGTRRAVVLLVLAIGIAGILLGVVLLLRGWGEPKPPPVLGEVDDDAPAGVVVRASYPGASAMVVAESVAAPIEQHVNGVDGMTRMTSRSGNDGSYELTVTFKAGTDLGRAEKLVQAGVALAQPMLPEAVKMGGVTVKKSLATYAFSSC